MKKDMILKLPIISIILAHQLYAEGVIQNKQSSEKVELKQVQSVTVTAQKQEEDILDVPISLSVVDGLTIEDRNINGVWKLMDNIPGLMNFDTGMSDIFSQPSMRGISAPATTFNTSVGLYVDGAPVLASPGFSSTLIDINRIEVLRGPQGTLYGKNTEAGVINIITNKPDNELRGKISAKFGESNIKMYTGLISGPIVEDQLYFALAGQKETKDGFLENKNLGGYDDNRDRYYGRGQLRWTPNDDLDISFIMSRISIEEGGSAQVANANMMAGFGESSLPDRTTYSDLRPRRDSTNDIQTFKIDYQLSDSIKVSSITARKVTDWNVEVDYDFTSKPLYHVYNDSKYSNLSQELRLNWDTLNTKGVIGIYADKHSNEINMGNIMSNSSRTSTTNRELSGDSYAIFGQIDYAFTDDLHLISGLRYEKQNMDYDDELLNINTEDSWSKLTPKISLQYYITPEVNTYVTVAQGYRTGGFNQTATDLKYQTFEPEELWNYEVGFKTTLFENKVQLNGSFYYMNIDNMQVEESIDPIKTYVTNAAKATSKGAELELIAQVNEQLSLTAGLSYNKTEFDSFSDALGDYSGNKNPFAPNYTANLGATYRNNHGFFVSADLAAYGAIYLDKENKNKRDAYKLVNTKIGYEGKDFDIYLYADNLFDERYDSLNYYGYYNNYSTPREVGIELVYHF